MAKKKAKKRSGGTRRRRVGAIGGDSMKIIIGAIAGSVVANMAASKLGATLDPKIKGAVLAVGGFLIAKQSNAFVKGAGIGIAANGGLQLAGALLPAGTLGAMKYDFAGQVSGFNDYPNNPQLRAIAGFGAYPNNPQLNVISGVGAGAC